MYPTIPLSKKDYIKKVRLPRFPSTNLAYLCGILVGDGNIHIRKEKYDYTLKCVGNPKDEKEFYWYIVRPTFKKTFGFSPKIKYFDDDTTFGFVVHSKSIIRFLTEIIKLPKGRKYNQLRIPKEFKKDKSLLICFIRGVFDTDGCISFKKRYKNYPYYPVISLTSKSKRLIKEISNALQQFGLKTAVTCDHITKDKRTRKGFTVISRLDLNGKDNLEKWQKTIKFYSPKHINKIKNLAKNYSGG